MSVVSDLSDYFDTGSADGTDGGFYDTRERATPRNSVDSVTGNNNQFEVSGEEGSPAGFSPISENNGDDQSRRSMSTLSHSSAENSAHSGRSQRSEGSGESGSPGRNNSRNESDDISSPANPSNVKLSLRDEGIHAASSSETVPPPPSPQNSRFSKETSLYHVLFGLTSFESTTSHNSSLDEGTKRKSGNVDKEKFEKIRVSGNISGGEEPLFKNVRLVQSISFHVGPIWTMKFSHCGEYLCTGGQDKRVMIWAVGLSHFRTEESMEGVNVNIGEDISSKLLDSAAEIATGTSAEAAEHSTPETSRPSSSRESSRAGSRFINRNPIRVLAGHTGDVIDVAWSRSQFILSASVDKTVRLWHTSRSESLQTFRHPDLVTSVEFHPEHDRYFISGCFDRRLRVWDIIPDGVVREWGQAPETITSVCFSPDGLTVVGGLINGLIYFFEYDGMKYVTQMSSRNKNGKYKDGKKVTGLMFLNKSDSMNCVDGNGNLLLSVDKSLSSSGPGTRSNHNSAGSRSSTGTNAGSVNGNMDASGQSTTNPSIATRPASGGKKKKYPSNSLQLLVTTNDHRIRLFQLEDYSLVCKYKGLRNSSMQIRAGFSDDGGHIVCGSDDGRVVIWKTKPVQRKQFLFFKGRDDRNSCVESFSCVGNDDVPVTVAVFAPVMSIAKMVAKHPGLSKLHDHAAICTNLDVAELSTKVIVTADYEGKIRVFVRGLL